MGNLTQKIRDCQLCSQAFSMTATQHRPRPVAWFHPDARILIAGQAPGMRVHQSGVPFDDRSGDRLRDWMGVDRDTFYDQSKIAIVPMAFCFPGYDAKGSDLPPPKICSQTWRDPVIRSLSSIKLTLLVGGYALNWHLGGRSGVTDRVRGWKDLAPGIFPLPHPSWRNNAFLRRNPWFETDLLPELKSTIRQVLS